MKIGSNTFNFYCNNVSGGAITGLTSGSFYLYGQVADLEINTYSPSTITEDGSGFYSLDIDLDTVGSGAFGVRSYNSGVYIAPDFWDVKMENQDFESLYSLFVTLQQAGTVDSVFNYTEVTTEPFKEGDDITIEHTVSTELTSTLTGWTNYKAELRNSLSPNTSAASATYICNAIVAVVDPLENTVTLDISGSNIISVVPEGSNTTTLYMDLQAYNPQGKKKTLVEFTIPIVRQITYN
jgi:hypothetical protein